MICDTAHNKEGLLLVMEQLHSESFKKLHIVLGVVDDKDLDMILPLFPENAIYYFCKPDVPRGLEVNSLAEYAARYNLNGKAYGSVNEAYKKALVTATKDDLVFIGGSTFVVAEVV